MGEEGGRNGEMAGGRERKGERRWRKGGRLRGWETGREGKREGRKETGDMEGSRRRKGVYDRESVLESIGQGD